MPELSSENTGLVRLDRRARRASLLVSAGGSLIVLAIYGWLVIRAQEARGELTAAEARMRDVQARKDSLAASVVELKIERERLLTQSQALKAETMQVQKELESHQRLLESIRAAAENEPSSVVRDQVLLVVGAKTPRQRAEALYAAGKIASARKDNKRAIDLFEAAITELPTFAQALNALGRLYAQQGDSRRAEELYVKAIESMPTYGYSYHNLGHLLFLEKRYAEAKRYLEQGLRADPKYVGSNELKALLQSIDRVSTASP